MIDPDELAEQFASLWSATGETSEAFKKLSEAMRNNIESYETAAVFSGCITPKFYLVIDRLRTIHDESVEVKADMSLVDNKDLGALLNEFFRLDKELRLLKPHIYVDAEDYRRST